VLGENWASTITVSGTAQPLVDSSEDAAPIVGAQPTGTGEFVMAGDSNMFTDNTYGAYAYQDNGQFVRDLCPGPCIAAAAYAELSTHMRWPQLARLAVHAGSRSLTTWTRQFKTCC
jgi:hypothetical protein